MNIHHGSKISFDLGNTIIFGEAGQKELFPDAERVISRLVSVCGTDNAFIISKVDPEQQKRAEHWLDNSGFLQRTGLRRNHVEFCPERHEKARIANSLGLRYFTDDRPEVLAAMSDIVLHRLLFQGIDADFEKFQGHLQGVIRVSTWIEIERYFFP